MSNVESGTELINKKGLSTWTSGAGAIVHDENTAEKRLQFSHNSGDNLAFTEKGVSLLATNNKQENILGDNFSTTKGDSFIQTQGNMEVRPFGDYTIVAGNASFFTSPLTNNWLDTYAPIAAAKAGPELAYGGTGNNTGATYPVDGTPAKDGSVEGGTYNVNPVQDNIQTLMEDTAADLANIETDMGVGGSIKLLTTKHLHMQAGGSAAAFDSGVTISNGRSVTSKLVPEDGSLTTETTSVPLHESKDTASAVPFGDINLVAGTKIRMNSGAGGVGIKSGGDININSTGRYTIGGAEVAIAGSTIGDAGRVTILSDQDIFMQSGKIVTIDSPNVVIDADNQITYITPDAVYSGNLHVQGDLVVEGCILAKGDITAGGRGGVSLLKHTHKVKGVESGGDTKTSDKPK